MNEVYVPHVGWLEYPAHDDVALFLREGWFEYEIQAFLFLYLRDGNTFIDCGAHAGLYSVLAGRLVGAAGRVVSIEPNPANHVILERNLKRNQVMRANAIQAAVYSRTEEMPFYVDAPGRSAYGSLIPQSDVPINGPCVKTVTLDGIRLELGIDHCAAVKIDTEGAEVEVLKGITQAAGKSVFPLLIVEFTELNLRRAGTGTGNLFHSLTEAGYQVCRFDPDERKLVRVEFDNPVWHANYFAAIAPDRVNDALQNAPEEYRRIAGEIIKRGRVCERLHRLVAEWEGNGPGALLEKTVGQLDEAYRRIGEANWRGDEANRRADEALRELEAVQKQIGAAEQRANLAVEREAHAVQRMQDALARVEDAYRSGEEAKRRVDASANRCTSLSEELNETHLTLGEFRAERDFLNRQIVSLSESSEVLQSRLREIATSRYVRFGRKSGILKSPWLHVPDAGVGPVDFGHEMDRALRHLARRGFNPGVLLDVGAGKGWWSVRAAAYFPQARLFMLDPLAEHEPYLKLLPERDPRFHFLRAAAGDQAGDFTMNLTQELEASSLLSWAGEDPSRQRRIPVTTLDQLMRDGQIAPPDLVKVDVQGFELRVLNGAQQVLQSTEVFIIEVNLYEFMRGCPRVHEIVSFFAKREFYLFDIAGMLRRPFGNDLAQMDLVFVSSRSILGSTNRWS